MFLLCELWNVIGLLTEIMTAVQIVNPALPFSNPIPGGLNVGKIIQIQGVFPAVFDASQYSTIELYQNPPDTVPFHISIRFNHRKVIRNTKLRNNWQDEEKDGPFPFMEGRQFVMQILVQPNCYQVSVNGQHCWTYQHRLPYAGVTHLNIDGPLTIWSVEYKGNVQIETYQPPIYHYQPPSPSPPATMRLANYPRLPYWGDLPQRLALGSVVEIKGSFPFTIDTSQYTEINLCQNSRSTISLHLSIRFNSNTAIRNTHRNGRWETEEKGGPFPFVLGREFFIRIVVQLSDYKISVNGAHCWSFSHRLPFGMVNGLHIDGPASIYQVDYTSTMEQQQIPQPTYVYVPQVTSPPQPTPSSMDNVYNPAVPFSYFINNGIKVGMMIYISGIPSINFQRFTISLQCDKQQSCPDVAFQFDVRGYNGTVVRNTRRNNRWEDEETAISRFPFYPSVPFDMMILVQNDKYMVAVDGIHFIEYYHRMTRFKRINILKIENDIRITSVRFSQ